MNCILLEVRSDIIIARCSHKNNKWAIFSVINLIKIKRIYFKYKLRTSRCPFNKKGRGLGDLKPDRERESHTTLKSDDKGIIKKLQLVTQIKILHIENDSYPTWKIRADKKLFTF